MVRRGMWAGLVALAWLGAAQGVSALGQDVPPGASPPASPPGPTAPAGVEGAGVAGAGAAGVDGAEFRRELRSVEESVTDLKEHVFRSKATLELLKELLVDTTRGGAKAVVWHVNHLGGAYSMESAEYYVDGKSVFSRTDTTGALDVEREFEVAQLPLAPGAHHLQVNLVLRGKGFKIFSYLKAYQFRLSSTYPFTLEQNRASEIRVVTESRGGLRNFVDRPTIVYEERVRDEAEAQ
jgi:hypothetical protein